MKFIAHRGNFDGPNEKLENSTEYISLALEKGFDVEVDVTFLKGIFYLGHDTPQEKIPISYLQNQKLWCHAKTIETVYEFQKYKDIHYFFHQKDDITLTSKNIIWTYPKKALTKNSVCNIHKKKILSDLVFCYGICSNYIEYFKENL